MSDSKLWEEAYASYKKPQKARSPRKPRDRTKAWKPQPSPQTALQKEYANNRLEIIRLQKIQTRLKEEMDSRGINTMVRAEYYDKNIHLYVLRLQGGNWYIGSSRDVEKRYKQHHTTSKGSKWTAKHKPIEIIETSDTHTAHDSEACKMEDDLTIQYAIKYCAQRVRGGGYSQVKITPHWPQEVIDSESMCSHAI